MLAAMSAASRVGMLAVGVSLALALAYYRSTKAAADRSVQSKNGTQQKNKGLIKQVKDGKSNTADGAAGDLKKRTGLTKEERQQKGKEKAERKRLAAEEKKVGHVEKAHASKVVVTAAGNGVTRAGDESTGVEEGTLEGTVLVLCSQELTDIPQQAYLLCSTLTNLDLSRNWLLELPAAIGSLSVLEHLNLSRNRLRTLPEEIGALQNLTTLSVLSNNLRPHARSLPLEALAQMPKLRVLDLRFNEVRCSVCACVCECVSVCVRVCLCVFIAFRHADLSSL
jgi:hypothetical protein